MDLYRCNRILLACAAGALLSQDASADIYNLYSGTGGGNLYTGKNSTGTVYAPVANNQISLTTTTYSTDTTAIFSRSDGLINYTQGGPGSIGDGSSGSGTYTRLFAAEQTGNNVVERAYNGNQTDDSNNPPSQQDADWDEKQGVGMPKATVGDVTIVTYNSTRYFELLLDGQENDSAVTLDELLVFTAPSRIDIDDAWVAAHPDPTLAELIGQFEGAGATLRYSLDDLNSDNSIANNNTLLLRTETGSGAGDMGFYLPVSAVSNYFQDFAGNGTAAQNTDRIYVWVQHGGEVGNLYPAGATANNQAIDFGAGATYEEWAYRKTGGSGNIQSLTPEPATGLAGLIIAAIAVCSRRREK